MPPRSTPYATMCHSERRRIGKRRISFPCIHGKSANRSFFGRMGPLPYGGLWAGVSSVAVERVSIVRFLLIRRGHIRFAKCGDTLSRLRARSRRGSDNRLRLSFTTASPLRYPLGKAYWGGRFRGSSIFRAGRSVERIPNVHL